MNDTNPRDRLKAMIMALPDDDPTLTVLYNDLLSLKEAYELERKRQKEENA